MGLLIVFGIIFSHFHIFSWTLNNGSFSGFGQYISDMSDGLIIIILWLIGTAFIGKILFGLHPIISNAIMLYPYYIVINWMVDNSFFVTDPWE